MGKFGWSLPPGCTHAMIDRLFEEQPCEMCGKDADSCVCPECPLCAAQGDPNCYREVDLGVCGGLHGKETKLQKLARAEFDISSLKEEVQRLQQYIEYLRREVEIEDAQRKGFSWWCTECWKGFNHPDSADFCLCYMYRPEEWKPE